MLPSVKIQDNVVKCDILRDYYCTSLALNEIIGARRRHRFFNLATQSSEKWKGRERER